MGLDSHTQPRPDKRGYIRLYTSMLRASLAEREKGEKGQRKADDGEYEGEEIMFDSKAKI